MLALGDSRGALEAFRSALRLAPFDPQATHGYARAMMGIDRPEAAVDQLEETLERHPDDMKLLNLLGVALNMVGRHEDAQGAFHRALALRPGDPDVATNLALSLALAGRLDEAIATLRPLAEQPQSTPVMRQNLALIYGLGGDFLAAERLSRLDLADREVEANLRYFRSLRSLGSSAAVAGALAGEGADRQTDPRTFDPEEDRPRVPLAVAAASQLGSEAGAPVPLTAAIGAATAGGDPPAAEDGHPPAASGVAAVALDASDLAKGRSPVGDWVLDLGTYPTAGAAAARWEELRARHLATLGDLARIHGEAVGSEPLLAGPLGSEADALRRCATLAEEEVACSPLKL
jgi:tetratricopeptide (TPR) repeat protein